MLLGGSWLRRSEKKTRRKPSSQCGVDWFFFSFFVSFNFQFARGARVSVYNMPPISMLAGLAILFPRGDSAECLITKFFPEWRRMCFVRRRAASSFLISLRLCRQNNNKSRRAFATKAEIRTVRVDRCGSLVAPRIVRKTVIEAFGEGYVEMLLFSPY